MAGRFADSSAATNVARRGFSFKAPPGAGAFGRDLFTVQIDRKQLREIRQMLVKFPRGFAKVASRAINKTAVFARTRIVRGLAKEMGFKQKHVKRDFVRLFRRASFRRLSAVILVHTVGRVPLARFSARQTKRGVSYKIGKQGRKTIRSAFILRGNTARAGAEGSGVNVELVDLSTGFRRGEGTVFKRVSKNRLPIIPLFGPSIQRVFEDQLQRARLIIQESNTRLASEMERQVGVLLAKRQLR